LLDTRPTYGDDAGDTRFLVALSSWRDLLSFAKYLFLAAIDGLGFIEACAESAELQHESWADSVRSRCSY
jgi:hypothetical protein